MELNAITAERFANLALGCIHREYPNKIAHVLQSDRDVRPPRELTPSFYGCFDWHSAVHGHWMLARLARIFPKANFVEKIRPALSKGFTKQNIAAETQYVLTSGRETFERPYGLAWLLQLAAELHEWEDRDSRRWSEILRPLEAASADRIKQWLPKLLYPIRDGEHPQTAFAFGLILDWARITQDREMEDLLASRIRALYFKDTNCPLAYEPSGQDFLSPCIAEADLLRRILQPQEFAEWLSRFLPHIPNQSSGEWLPPAIVTDAADGKLAHLDGLNLSRAWMLEGIASGLPSNDSRLAAIISASAIHAEAGLRSVTDEHYEGSHWLGTFAVYLLTRRGITTGPLKLPKAE